MMTFKINDLFLYLKQITPANFSPLMLMQLAVCGAFLVVSLFSLLWAMIFNPGALDNRKAAWRPPVLEGKSPFDQAQPQNTSAAFTRPIFNKSRKPSDKDKKKTDETSAAALPATPVEPPPGAVLSAIIKQGSVENAFIISTSDPQGKWLKVGDNFEGWTLTKIEATKVLLKSGDMETTLKLYTEDKNQLMTIQPQP